MLFEKRNERETDCKQSNKRNIIRLPPAEGGKGGGGGGGTQSQIVSFFPLKLNHTPSNTTKKVKNQSKYATHLFLFCLILEYVQF